MMTLQRPRPAQAAVAACGGVGLIAALLMDPHLVETHLSKDGHLELATVVALSALRPIVFAVSLAAAFAALFLQRLQRHFEIVIFIMPILVSISLIIFKVNAGISNPLYLRFVAEDSPVEYMTFLIFLSTAIIAGFVSHRALMSGIYIGSAFQCCILLFCLLVAFEEISYGQRIFGFETPAYLEEMNTQKEFNLHNISGVEMISWYLSYSAILTFGLFGWVGRPAVNYLSLNTLQSAYTADLLFPPWYVTSYFAPVAITWAQDTFTFVEDETLIIWQDQEPAELSMSFGFLIFVLAALRASRGDSPIGRRRALTS
jgi:hypothetical protein